MKNFFLAKKEFKKLEYLTAQNTERSILFIFFSIPS